VAAPRGWGVHPPPSAKEAAAPGRAGHGGRVAALAAAAARPPAGAMSVGAALLTPEVKSAPALREP